MLHAVLPPTPAFFDNFELGSTEFMECIWSDYVEKTPIETESIRKQKGVADFNRSMDAFKSTVLIKGHFPTKPPITTFDNKCITIQTTRVFKGICDRHIVIIDLEKPVNNANDIEIINLDKLLETEENHKVLKKQGIII